MTNDVYTLINQNVHEGKIHEPTSLRITFHITDKCNMACKYCYESKGNRVINVNYAKSLIDEVINFLCHQDASFLYGYLNCEKNSIVQLDFIGGEVTLYMEIVDEICDYFFKQCLSNNLIEIYDKAVIILQSNGTTYFNEDVQSFLNRYKDRVIFPITIDGCKECHDTNRIYKDGTPTFDEVDLATKHYIANHNMPDTKMTFSSNTFKYIKDSCEYLYVLGYKTCRMNTDITHKLSIQETNDYYEALIQTADWIIDNQNDFLPSPFLISYTQQRVIGLCGMYGNQIAIDVDGNLFNCYRMCRDSIGELEKPIGNIVTKTLDFDFVNEFIDNVDSRSNPLCADCPIKFGCEECPAENKKHNGSWYISWNNCGQTIAQAKAQLYFLQRAKDTDYPYFREELSKVENHYDPNFKYLLDYESEEKE